jgi:hypothetical protein
MNVNERTRRAIRLRTEKEILEREKEQAMDQALDMFELYDDALAMININDNTYSYRSKSDPFQLLGLAEDDSKLRSFLRLWHLQKSVEVQIAPTPTVCLLDDGMLDATPRTEEHKQLLQRNAQSSLLLSLPPELRNRIFRRVMGGFSVWIGSGKVKGEYKDAETKRITDRVRLLKPSDRKAHHENILRYTALGKKTVHCVSEIFVKSAGVNGDCHGPAVSSPFVSLQQTCRQIYAETAKLPFSRINQFHYRTECHLEAFEMWIRPSQLQAITKLLFFVYHRVNGPSENARMHWHYPSLSMLTGVKHIHVTVQVTARGRNVHTGYADWTGYVSESMRDEARELVKVGLSPRILEHAPKGVELVFEKEIPEV